MQKSESIAALAAALAKAQGAMKNAIKDSANPFFKSKYADLAGVADACRDELTVNGLAVMQFPEVVEGKVLLTYVLAHASGEWVSGILEMTPIKKTRKDEKGNVIEIIEGDPQSIGSVITYARRYSLAALVGVATEDDDGNAASGKEVLRTDQPIAVKNPLAGNPAFKSLK